MLLRRLVVAATIITALLHCRICSRQRRLPRPPPQHPTSVPFIRKQPSTVATNPHNCYHSPYKVIAAKFADTKQPGLMLLVLNQSYLLWNAEICPSKPLCRVSPKFQSRRSATELFTVSRSALVLRLLHSIAVSLLLHCHAMLRARGVPLDLCGAQLCRAPSLVPGARPLLRRRLGGNCTVASSSPCEPAIFITKSFNFSPSLR